MFATKFLALYRLTLLISMLKGIVDFSKYLINSLVLFFSLRIILRVHLEHENNLQKESFTNFALRIQQNLVLISFEKSLYVLNELYILCITHFA